jgi:LCP family protein required for cell wall assembly
MRKETTAVDGFVPRKNRRTLGSASDPMAKKIGQAHPEATMGTSLRPIRTASGVDNSYHVSRQEIDDSLKDIDDDRPQPQPRRGIFRRNKPPKSRRRKIIGWVIKLFILTLLVVGGWLAYNFISNSSQILKGNIFDIFQNKPLEMDKNGRTNILIYGTSGDVTDENHPGANLTDTLMVLSIDQNKKNAFMISLPRDLYVDYGRACNSGYQGKINEVYFCYSDAGKNEEAGAKGLGKIVSRATGLTTQYYAHINWAVVTKAVNAVGGVDVNVEGNGYNGYCTMYGIREGGVVDANMKIKYQPGKHHMNGVQALTFSRARGAKGACGLDRGDFDRQANQQKVLKALQAKASSAETLTNVGKVTSLMDALGQNLRTNFATSEIQTLMSLARDISGDKIQSIDLVSKEDPVITSGNIPGAGSIQVPVAGTYDYSGIKAYISKRINASEVSKEEAHVAVFNGGSAEGYATKQAENLEAKGFTITATENTPSGKYKGVAIYDLSGKKPSTKNKLASLYGVTVTKGKAPFAVSSDTDFVIIFGKEINQ